MRFRSTIARWLLLTLLFNSAAIASSVSNVHFGWTDICGNANSLEISAEQGTSATSLCAHCIPGDTGDSATVNSFARICLPASLLSHTRLRQNPPTHPPLLRYRSRAPPVE